MSVLVVYNPIGHVRRDVLESSFQRYFPDRSVHYLETSREEAIPAIIAPHLDKVTTVVAVGGDGTVSGVAAGLLDTGIPLGIVPAGSTNMLAKVNRVPQNPERAVALLAGDHRVEAIDAGVCGDRVLLHLGGAGLDARIFARSSSALKRRIKWAGYGPPALQSLRDPASNVRVTVDGSSIEVASRFVLIANSGSLIHPALTVIPTESRSDGLFEVGIFTADSSIDIARSFADLTVMRWRTSPRIIQLKGKEISVEADPPLPFELDGDVIGATPFALSVRQRAVSMICGL